MCCFFLFVANVLPVLLFFPPVIVALTPPDFSDALCVALFFDVFNNKAPDKFSDPGFLVRVVFESNGSVTLGVSLNRLVV